MNNICDSDDKEYLPSTTSLETFFLKKEREANKTTPNQPIIITTYTKF
jgi:hypothetical protein